MNVLSLFDGISCGRVALERAGIAVENYFASEIDKWAIQVSAANWPGIQQVGDVCNVRAADLPKIDLLIGGSPCQGFSFAGKGLNFDDPRSALFFEYVRVLNEIRKTNPDVIFLLENVPMKREHQMVISKHLGVEPIKINAARISAQNRVRLFWTNIKAAPLTLFGDVRSTIPQPKDRKIYLKDILQPPEQIDEKYFLSQQRTERMLKMAGKYTQLDGQKAHTFTQRGNANWNGDFDKIAVNGKSKPDKRKASCFTAGGNSAGNHSDMDIISIEQTPRGFNKGGQRAMHGKTPSVTSNRWEHNNHLVIHQQDRLNFENGKARSVPAGSNGNASHHTNTETQGQYRRLTPIEVERLFTLPENYTRFLSSTYFLYICQKIIGGKIWQLPAKKIPATIQLQADRLDCVKNTTIGLSEQAMFAELFLTNLNHAPTLDVIESSRRSQDIVCCTTNELSSMGKAMIGSAKSLCINKDVCIVIQRLEKKEEAQRGCVIDITKTSKDMATLFSQIRKGLKSKQEVILVELEEAKGIERLWRIALEGDYGRARLFITLILISLIIQSRIFTSVEVEASIRGFIGNLKMLPQNFIGMELSDLTMVNITLNSDSQRYCLMGNGWVVDVIAHIFSHIEK